MHPERVAIGVHLDDVGGRGGQGRVIVVVHVPFIVSPRNIEAELGIEDDARLVAFR